MSQQNRAEIWLNKALELENRGRDYYLAASQKAAEKIISDFFQNMADMELQHIEAIKNIYAKLGNASCWLEKHNGPHGTQTVNKIFLDMSKHKPKPEDGIVEVIEKCLAFEVEAEAFYKNEIPNAECSDEKDFLTAMAAEERDHQNILTDMKLYYTDPESWAEKMDNGHLDGV